MRLTVGIILLLIASSSVDAGIIRFNGSFGEGGNGTGNWTTPTSWNTGNVPTAADEVRFNWGGAVGTVDSDVGTINSLIFGLDENNTGLNIESGGTLTIANTARIGDNRTSTMNVNSGGTLNVGGALRFSRRDNRPGSGPLTHTFNVYGTVDIAGTLQIGDNWNGNDSDATAIFTIGDGGFVSASNAFFTNTSNIQDGETLKLIIDGTGSLAIDGDRTALVDGWLADGFLEAGADQDIARSFDGSVTTITAFSTMAVPEPSSALLVLGATVAVAWRRRRTE